MGAANENQTLSVTAHSNWASIVQPSVNYTSPQDSGTVSFSLAPNQSGSGTVYLRISDGEATVERYFSVTVRSVNDAPIFSLAGTSLVVAKNAGRQTRTAWATNISAGPLESSQTLSFLVTGSNTGLFSTQPAIAPDGTLTFTPARNKTGTATISVKLQDNGGTLNGGVNTSAIQTFTIRVG
jgi:hypothetical protein